VMVMMMFIVVIRDGLVRMKAETEHATRASLEVGLLVSSHCRLRCGWEDAWLVVSVATRLGDEVLDDREEFLWAEYGLYIAKKLLRVPWVPLQYDQPVFIVCKVGKRHLFNMAVSGVINDKKQQTVIICVMHKFKVAREVLLIMKVKLRVHMHEHGVRMNEFHDLLHFIVIDDVLSFLKRWCLCLSFLIFDWCDTLNGGSPSPYGAKVFFLSQKLNDSVFHLFILLSEHVPVATHTFPLIFGKLNGISLLRRLSHW
jgi:hypothetical protein